MTPMRTATCVCGGEIASTVYGCKNPDCHEPHFRTRRNGLCIDCRYWTHVQRTADCWTWTASLDDHGYGKVRRSGRNIRAHRVAWELTYGPIPDGLFVLHRCDNPPCVNPAHLWLGTMADNTADMIAKGRGRGQFPLGHRPTRWDRAA